MGGQARRPASAERLGDGRTLVAEFDKDGKKVWSKGGFALAFDARRLASGNTLVVDTAGMHEANAKGEEVWKWAQTNVSRVCGN